MPETGVLAVVRARDAFVESARDAEKARDALARSSRHCEVQYTLPHLGHHDGVRRLWSHSGWLDLSVSLGKAAAPYNERSALAASRRPRCGPSLKFPTFGASERRFLSVTDTRVLAGTSSTSSSSSSRTVELIRPSQRSRVFSCNLKAGLSSMY